ncbi:hypothetical protein [Pedosphaera parvula]|uniref:Uncharacterized protein n=1 Tax=Pedosphaera parvula (strain Ellin514) TaxID=320771 RepID=B9XNH3_PEDPL|nr:hypothetical protein [Pedosphaera parvula]EEF58632.1 hypothetical protein Cflav_PD1533 [Pedosphaera parvula Ellin514]
MTPNSVTPFSQNFRAQSALNAAPSGPAENRRLRIHRAEPTPTTTSPEAETVPPVAPPYAQLSAANKQLTKVSMSRGKPAMGIMAGVAAGALAAFAWYLLTLATGYEIRIVSWLIGVAVGLGMRKFGCPTTHKYGSIAVLITALAIIGGQYFVIQRFVDGSLDGLAENAYVEHTAFARKALNASSDQEISNLFAHHYGKNEFFVTKEEIQDFRATLPELQDFLNGKPSKAEFIKTVRSRADTLSYRWSVFQRSRSLGFLMWLVFGILAAYRVATG